MNSIQEKLFLAIQKNYHQCQDLLTLQIENINQQQLIQFIQIFILVLNKLFGQEFIQQEIFIKSQQYITEFMINNNIQQIDLAIENVRQILKTIKLVIDNYRLQQLQQINTQENQICPICLNFDSDTFIETSQCKHKFHKYCIEQCIQYNNKCPICRKLI